MTENNRNNMRALFDHVHRILTMVMTAGLIWMGATTYNTSIQVAVMANQLKIMEKYMENGYSFMDARKDFARIDGEIKEIKRRVTRLEK